MGFFTVQQGTIQAILLSLEELLKFKEQLSIPQDQIPSFPTIEDEPRRDQYIK
jgi:hypothetical protein